ncbi:isochorismatase family protein [Nocardiopsis quinghaiensis]|uniref:isochorismatase family protein n=1 Tax=Nocardiopsis quinghaiensis TaxID=464995 RepID=UPI0012389CD4|nr:isochorismatase family protein [Nocardiopsis quinghaiensis]
MTGPRGAAAREAATADHTRAGFFGELAPPRRPALLVVDLVNAYLDPLSPLYAGDEDIVDRVAGLAETTRSAGLPVVFTYVGYRSDGRDGGLFYRKVPALELFAEGADPRHGEPPEPLRPRPEDITLTKQYPSAFFGTALASTLHALGSDGAVVTGTSTSGCVRATAVDALCHGLSPVVVTDAVGDRDPGAHQANLFDLGAKYAELLTTREATEWLEGLR